MLRLAEADMCSLLKDVDMLKVLQILMAFCYPLKTFNDKTITHPSYKPDMRSDI